MPEPVDAVPSPPNAPDPGPRDIVAVRFYLTSATLTILVIAIASSVLAGWIFDVPALESVFAGLPATKINSAIALLFSAIALWIYRGPARGSSIDLVLRTSIGMAIALGALTIVEHATGRSLGIDQMLVLDTSGHGEMPGRMPLSTAAAFVLFGAALLTADARRSYGLAQVLAGLVVAIAILSGVGYFLGLRETTEPGRFGYMSVQIAVGLLLLGLALFFARPDQGVMDVVIDAGPAGLIARQLVPVVVVLPPALAWLSWQGVERGLYEPAFAMTLFVTLAVSALCLAILAGGRLLAGFEAKRATAEAQHTESEERLRRAVTGAPIPMIIHDGDRILHMSRGWTELSGYLLAETPTLSAWIARAQPALLPDLPRYVARLSAATETLAGGEHPVTTRDGQTRMWELSSTPLGSLGPDRLFVTMAVDVTARKQAEADLRKMNEGLEQRIAERTTELTRANDALRRQSDQLREQATLLDLVRDGILVRDLRGTIVYWSAGAADMYGWTRQDACGRVSHDLLGAEYPRPLAEIERHVLETGDWEGEVSQRTRNGERVLVASRWTLTRTERGTPEGFLEVNRDITSRKIAQDSLRDSEARFRAVAETAIEGIVSVDETGVIQYWNPGAERIFGRPASEAIGQPLATAMPDPLLASSRLPAAQGAVGTTFETIGRRKDGGECPLELSLSAWTNAQGARFFTAIVRDITERKAAERALESKADELARSNQELEQFAYVASHDLQEPLRMVSNYTQLLARRYTDRLDEDANEFIAFAVDGATRMQDLIRDLLQYARVGTRGKEFKPTPAEQIVADALANLSTAIDEAHADVVVDPLPTLVCDATQMAQVFQNLVGNAVKFRRPGTRPRVHISATRGARAWTIAIADNGIGIEPKYFDRIFQMFQRLHARADYPGTGIGLALCKKIVERHGGRIRVESAPGSGATFSFTMPDAPGQASEAR
jgi:PAS domain S-box-containing protein